MNPRLARWPGAVITALDRLLNAIFFGDDRMSFSTRAYEAGGKGERWGCVLCHWLGKIQRDHCRRAAEFDRAVATLIVIRAIAPPDA